MVSFTVPRTSLALSNSGAEVDEDSYVDAAAEIEDAGDATAATGRVKNIVKKIESESSNGSKSPDADLLGPSQYARGSLSCSESEGSVASSDACDGSWENIMRGEVDEMGKWSAPLRWEWQVELEGGGLTTEVELEEGEAK